jgi:hypothetical protein
MGKPFLILVPAETISYEDIDKLCAELYELARTRAHGNSSAVDLAEWRAAKIIQMLIREREKI